ncbi:thioredoxin [Anaerobacterium chartisolvens]|uniref:Thioredoxin n=1 Tax=Anaerobacterium chartisolvens TaxID=1297424 RepID=A0A369B8N9_9FIRM|nr:thioredoxin domain-containing protein [Anaerobacterium chartisolvens]RCX17900.1 thioredoxin [Anaerobacterium chartisolvens]
MDNENNTKFKKGLAVKIIMPVVLICVVVGIWVVKNEQKNTDPVETDKLSVLESQNHSVNLEDKPTDVESQSTSVGSTDKSSMDESETHSAVSTDKPATVESQDSGVTSTEKPSVVKSEKPSAAPTDKPIEVKSEKPSAAPTDKPIEVESEKTSADLTDKPSTVNPDNVDFDLHVTEKIDLEKLKSYGLPIVIDFGADSCIPCKQMAPVLEDLNAELKGKAIIKFVDVWKYRDLAEGYPISLIPTQIFIDANGNPFKPKDPQTMQMRLYSTRDTNEHVFTAHEGGMTKEQLVSALEEMGLE